MQAQGWEGPPSFQRRHLAFHPQKRLVWTVLTCPHPTSSPLLPATSNLGLQENQVSRRSAVRAVEEAGGRTPCPGRSWRRAGGGSSRWPGGAQTAVLSGDNRVVFGPAVISTEQPTLPPPPAGDGLPLAQPGLMAASLLITPRPD